MDTPIQQQVQDWQRIWQQADIDLRILNSIQNSVNLLLIALDENFECEVSKKLSQALGLYRNTEQSSSEERVIWLELL